MANSSPDPEPVPGTSPSRREFFHKAGLTAGGLYALATPSLLGPWLTGAEAATSARAFIGGRFGLELDGAFCGLVSSVAGGNIVGEFHAEPTGADGFQRKRIVGTKIEPLTVETGLDMNKPWYDWITRTLNLENLRKSVALIEMDANFKEISRRTFANAVIAEIEFPECNAASKDPSAKMAVSIASDQLKVGAGSGQGVPGAGARGQKPWLPGNFRLNIQGLEQATQKASKIDAFTIKRSAAVDQLGQARDAGKSPGGLEFSNLVITVADAYAAPFYAWHNDFVVRGANSQDKERPGVLEFLSADMRTVLAAVQFFNLGVIKVANEATDRNAEQIRRTKVEMYCERMTATFNA